MTNKQSWAEANELNLKCPHGNLVGWCDDCPKEYFNYVKDFISKLLTSKAEQTEREKYKEIKNGSSINHRRKNK